MELFLDANNYLCSLHAGEVRRSFEDVPVQVEHLLWPHANGRDSGHRRAIAVRKTCEGRPSQYEGGRSNRLHVSTSPSEQALMANCVQSELAVTVRFHTAPQVHTIPAANANDREMRVRE